MRRKLYVHLGVLYSSTLTLPDRSSQILILKKLANKLLVTKSSTNSKQQVTATDLQLNKNTQEMKEIK